MKIAIIGGGIGGLICALRLHQQGHQLTVFERDTEPRTLGAGIVLWSNATKLLDKFGLLAAVTNVAQALTALRTLDDQGNLLNELPLTLLEKQMDDYPNLAISRHALHELLLNKLQQNSIYIHYACKAEHITSTDLHAEVIFSNGKKYQADLIIGADGRMQSIARKFILAQNTPCYQHYVNWIGLTNHFTTLDSTSAVLDYWGSGQRFGAVPLRNQSLYWAACLALPLAESRIIGLHVALLTKLFANWPDVINNIITATSEQHIRAIAVYDLEPATHWFKQRVCLLGDAAHASLPTSGQGAAQAIEDCYHLGKALIDHKNVDDALLAYQQARIAKTTSITIAARRFATNLFQLNQQESLVRNTKLQHADPLQMITNMANFWSHGL